jgi:hypothetical protein
MRSFSLALICFSLFLPGSGLAVTLPVDSAEVLLPFPPAGSSLHEMIWRYTALGKGKIGEGSLRHPAGFTQSGTFDTVALTVDDLALMSGGAQSDSEIFFNSTEFQVRDRITTVIPGPGPFDPPTTIIDVIDLGLLRLDYRAEFSINMAPETLPGSLAIDPATLRTSAFQIASGLVSIDVMELTAFLNGVEVASEIGGPFTNTATVEGLYQCGGLLPNAFCRLNMTSSPSILRVLFRETLAIPFEDVFPDYEIQGETNYSAEFTVVTVPEPSTALLLALGLAGLWRVGRAQARA